MNLNKWGRPLTAVALIGALTACDEGLTEINQNPNNPEVVPVATVLSSGIWDLVSNNGGRGTHGEWTLLYHLNTWAQHTAQSAYNDEDNYTPRQGINQNIWQEMYAGALTDLARVKEMAAESGDQNLGAVAEILTVYGFLFLTDTFGDIPYSQALNLEEFPQPEFDAQATIYPDLLARLSAAAGQINPAGSTLGWAAGDLIYGGNLDRWQEFANSLRLRIAMRVQETELGNAGGTARTHFAQAWTANRFDSVEDAADLDWTGTLPSQHPFFEQIVLGGRTADFRVSATLVDHMKSTNDPRLEVYAEPAASDGVIRGLPQGNLPQEVGGTVSDFSTIGSAFIAANAPSVLMSYAEVLFLGAEAAARGWITGSASALCAQAITASMQEHGIPAGEIAAYLAANPCTTIADIAIEKWVALYLAGGEAFADARRLYDEVFVGFFTPPAKAVIGQLPTRMPYPENEGLYNENFADVANVTYEDPMWWMR